MRAIATVISAVLTRRIRLTLGNVYDMDLKRNETLIKEVIVQAQGEVRTPNILAASRMLNAE